jgi:hypothetical protein
VRKKKVSDLEIKYRKRGRRRRPSNEKRENGRAKFEKK